MSRTYQPSIITCGRRYTRVCKVRVAQCVYIAQSGSESQTSIEAVSEMPRDKTGTAIMRRDPGS